METKTRLVNFQSRLFASLEQWLDGRTDRDDRTWQALAHYLGYAQSTVSRYRTLSAPVTEDFVFAVADRVPGMEWVIPAFVAAKFGERDDRQETIPREAIEAAARSLENIAEKAAEAAKALRSQGLEIDERPTKKKRPRGKGPP